MSGTIFSRKSRSYNCVEYELQSVLESSIFGWSCVFGLSSPSHVEGLPFPCHNIPEYIPSIAHSCKTTEMSELKSNKAVLLQRVWWSFWICHQTVFKWSKSFPPAACLESRWALRLPSPAIDCQWSASPGCVVIGSFCQFSHFCQPPLISKDCAQLGQLHRSSKTRPERPAQGRF